MRVRGILLTIVVVLALLLAVLNWGTLVTPVPLDLLVFRLEWPLGVGLLGAAVVLALLFFLASLFDRAGQLRQLTQIERQRDAAQRALDACREAREEDARGAVSERLDALGATLAQGLEGVRASVREEVTAAEARQGAALEALEARVVRVRDELAADIAQAEDALRRRLDDDGAADA